MFMLHNVQLFNTRIDKNKSYVVSKFKILFISKHFCKYFW